MTSLRQKMIEDMQIRNLAVNTQQSEAGVPPIPALRVQKNLFTEFWNPAIPRSNGLFQSEHTAKYSKT